MKVEDVTSFLQSDSRGKMTLFFVALALTLVLELVAAFIILSLMKVPLTVLRTVLLGNFISLPIVWFVFPLLRNPAIMIVSAEVFAFLFEAFFVYALNRSVIGKAKSCALSAIMNIVSFVVGGFLLVLAMTAMSYYGLHLLL